MGKRTVFSRLIRVFCLPLAILPLILSFRLAKARGAETAIARARIVLVNPAAGKNPVDNSNAGAWLTAETGFENQVAGNTTAQNHRHFRVVQQHKRVLTETVKSLPREVSISVTEPNLGTFRLLESGELLAPHKNKYGRDYDRPTPPSSLYEQP